MDGRHSTRHTETCNKNIMYPLLPYNAVILNTSCIHNSFIKSLFQQQTYILSHTHAHRTHELSSAIWSNISIATFSHKYSYCCVCVNVVVTIICCLFCYFCFCLPLIFFLRSSFFVLLLLPLLPLLYTLLFSSLFTRFESETYFFFLVSFCWISFPLKKPFAQIVVICSVSFFANVRVWV